MATPTATFLGLLATALSAPERARLNSMSSDLRFILSEFEIPDRIQLRAVELGYKSLALFAVLGDDRPSVRSLIATDFFLNAQEPNLDADLALQARLMSAQILAAWLSAGTRATEEAKQSADNRLLRLPNLISRTALTALRTKYEQFAMNDLRCRERYFVTPTVLINASLAMKPNVAAGSASPPPLKSVSASTDGPKPDKKKSRKQAQRAKLKEKAKPEAVRGLPPGFPDAKRTKIARTPDGRNICGFFQLPAGCRKQNCSFLHVCDRCYGNHPAHKRTTGQDAGS